MGIFRFLFGSPIAAVITLLIFLGMAALIRQEVYPPTTPPGEIPNVTADIDETDPDEFKKKISPPKIDETPPPPPNPSERSESPAGPSIPVDKPDIEADDIETDVLSGAFLKPDIKFPPSYPQRCMQNAAPVETVIIQLDVDPSGGTANAEVVESTNSCLNRAALKSVERWKYTPKVVDGQPVWRRGVRAEIIFELAE